MGEGAAAVGDVEAGGEADGAVHGREYGPVRVGHAGGRVPCRLGVSACRRLLWDNDKGGEGGQSV